MAELSKPIRTWRPLRSKILTGSRVMTKRNQGQLQNRDKRHDIENASGGGGLKPAAAAPLEVQISATDIWSQF